MLINDVFYAPVFGLWNDTESQMPDEGQCVLGMAWTDDKRPIIVLIEWNYGDDGEEVWSLWMRPDAVTPPPWAWCEARFLHPICTIGEGGDGCEWCCGDDEDDDDDD